jgi:hypothetical protein
VQFALFYNNSLNFHSAQMQQEMQQRQRQMQMQREGQGMEPGGQRPQTPGSMDNAPSPSKKPRLDNGAGFEGPGMGPGGRPIGNPMLPNGMDPNMAGFAGPNGQPKMEVSKSNTLQ